jgi:hypothetical protein
MRLDRLRSERRLSEARRDYEEWRARYRSAIGTEPPSLYPAGADAVAGVR